MLELLQNVNPECHQCFPGCSVVLSSSLASFWFFVRGFMHASPPSHKPNIVHPSLEQLQAAVRHPELLQLQLISCSICEGELSVPRGTVRGRRIPWWSHSQPYPVGSISGGNSRSAAFQLATWRWHLCTFSVKASVVGGRELSFTDDAPLFPVFKRHSLTLHSAMSSWS